MAQVHALSGEVIQNPSTLTVKMCPSCSITYAAPTEFFDRIDERGGNWFCPNGHSLIFTKTQLQRAQEDAAAARRRATQADDAARYYRQQRDKAERRRRAAKGQLTKAKKRIGNGVCPCCNRHFTNVERHMASQHPDYAES